MKRIVNLFVPRNEKTENLFRFLHFIDSLSVTIGLSRLDVDASDGNETTFSKKSEAHKAQSL